MSMQERHNPEGFATESESYTGSPTLFPPCSHGAVRYFIVTNALPLMQQCMGCGDIREAEEIDEPEPAEYEPEYIREDERSLP